jgi:hypothetical protein
VALRPLHTAPRLAYYRTMPEDDIEKFISEQKTLEAHRQGLIKELLRQKEAAIKAFDDKLAKLGYDGEHATKRSHHKDDAEKKPE